MELKERIHKVKEASLAMASCPEDIRNVCGKPLLQLP